MKCYVSANLYCIYNGCDRMDGNSRSRWIPSSEEYKSSEPGLNACITDEFLGSCPETFGVGGKAEAMSYPNGF